MKNDLQIFEFHGHKVRTVIVDGEVWFIARDVATVLGYAKPENAISRHCKYAKSLSSLISGEEGLNLPGNTVIVPESDVYRLIVKSQLPSSEAFENWVFGTVLPSIRKTGRYEVAPQHQIPQSFAEALQLAANQAKLIEGQQKQIEQAQPKVEAYDDFMTSEGAQTMVAVAKALDVRVNNLFKFLRMLGILRENRLPMQPYVERGYFTVHIFPYYGQKKVKNRGKTLVTPKGVEYIRRKIKQHRELAKSLNVIVGKKGKPAGEGKDHDRN